MSRGSRRVSVTDSTLKSVSYTHLRAHETRHDLVCRLLLEKKKGSRRRLPSAAIFFVRAALVLGKIGPEIQPRGRIVFVLRVIQ